MQHRNRTTSESRRAFLAGVAALLGSTTQPDRVLAQDRPIVNAPTLLENDAGGYRVLPAGSVFCGGVVPHEGREIVHALVAPWVPLREAWAFVQAHLQTCKLPMQALCGMELRMPEQLSVQGFRDFNAPYVEQLRKHRLVIGNYSAVCRTNVVPASDKPQEAVLHAFSYCAPAQGRGATFCISGTADIDERGRIVAEGDVSSAGMRKRMQHCVDAISLRLAQLELDWSMATHVDLCVARDVDDLIGELMVPALKGALRRGLRVHHARPPIVGTEVELECRGVLRELVAGAAR